LAFSKVLANLNEKYTNKPKKRGEVRGDLITSKLPKGINNGGRCAFSEIVRGLFFMALIRDYKRYREVGQRLCDKIMRRALSERALNESGTLLGILRQGVFVFHREEDMNVLMDFALNEYKSGTKNAVQIYREKFGWKNDLEKELLDSLLSSYTSLFKIVSVLPSENTVILYDLLNDKKDIKLLDINFSRTADPGLLIFTRLLPFKDFNITSGMAFVFPKNTENFFLKRYKKLTEKTEPDALSLKRFIFFYNWNKTKGLNAITL